MSLGLRRFFFCSLAISAPDSAHAAASAKNNGVVVSRRDAAKSNAFEARGNNQATTKTTTSDLDPASKIAQFRLLPRPHESGGGWVGGIGANAVQTAPCFLLLFATAAVKLMNRGFVRGSKGSREEGARRGQPGDVTGFPLPSSSNPASSISHHHLCCSHTPIAIQLTAA